MGTALNLNEVAAQSQYAAEQLEELRGELRALRKDAERYRWLRDRLLAVDWDYMGSGDSVLVFTVPPETIVSADCDATMDSAMQAGAAVGAA